MTISDWREKIDSIDDRLLVLLNERARCALEIGKLKRAEKIAIYNPEREKAILDRLILKNEGPLTELSIKKLFERIIDESRHLERFAEE